MRQELHSLHVSTRGKGLVPIDRPVLDWVAQSGIETGLLTLWCRHTSASLTVQENADPTVRADIERYFETLVPSSLAATSMKMKARMTCPPTCVPCSPIPSFQSR